MIRFFSMVLVALIMVLPGWAQTPGSPSPTRPAPELVLHIWSATWCGPCHALHDMLEAQGWSSSVPLNINGQTVGVRVVMHDIDQDGAGADAAHVRSVPTLIMYSGGSVLGRSTGSSGAEGLRSTLTAMVTSDADLVATLGGSAPGGSRRRRVAAVPEACRDVVRRARYVDSAIRPILRDASLDIVERRGSDAVFAEGSSPVVFNASVAGMVEELDPEFASAATRLVGRITRNSRGEIMLTYGRTSTARDGAPITASVLSALVPAQCHRYLSAAERRRPVARLVATRDGMRHWEESLADLDRLELSYVSTSIRRAQLETAIANTRDWCDRVSRVVHERDAAVRAAASTRADHDPAEPIHEGSKASE